MVGPKKEERRTTVARSSPTKGTPERTLAAAPRTGSVVKVPPLVFQEPRVGLRLVVCSEAVPLTQRISSSCSRGGLRRREFGLVAGLLSEGAESDTAPDSSWPSLPRAGGERQ